MKAKTNPATYVSTAAALLLAACGGSSTPQAETAEAMSGGETVKCLGIHECKGQSACGVEGGHACAGQNDCKGKGWIKVSQEDCDAKGGTLL